MKKCGKCGHEESKDNALFCDNCGNNISQAKILPNTLVPDQLTVPVYRIPKDQFEKLLKSNRMTIGDGLTIGFGFLLLHIFIGLGMFFFFGSVIRELLNK